MAYRNFGNVSGTFPSEQTVEWPALKNGSEPEVYIADNNLYGKLRDSNGSLMEYRLSLKQFLDKGYTVDYEIKRFDLKNC